MKVGTQEYGDVTVVELRGDLDGDLTELLQSTVADVTVKRRRGIVLDMSAVGFIDGQGLELLLWVRDYCNEHQTQLRLAGLDEHCAKILEVTRLEDEFNRYAELAEAVKSLV